MVTTTLFCKQFMKRQQENVNPVVQVHDCGPLCEYYYVGLFLTFFLTVKAVMYFLPEESLKHPYVLVLIKWVLHHSHSLQITEKEHYRSHIQH